MNDTSLTDRIPELLPFDDHNKALAANVSPRDWQNPEPADNYNMVVIGGGSAGLITAAGTAGLGGKVALIERHMLGGDCLNVGCVPSKALIRAARAAFDVQSAKELGVCVPDGVTVDFGAVMERMRRLRAEISPNDSAQRFRELGVDVFIGEGSFVDRNSIQVGDHRLRFSRACIATGARAANLPIPGLETAGVLTNETVFSLTELPKRLAVIGAGPIGCELAQSFARFGSKVTVFEIAPQILIREDPDAAHRVHQALLADGVDLRCGVQIASLAREGDERIVSLSEGESISESCFDQILVAVGRAPNVEGLELDRVGIEHDRFGVKVDDNLRTTVPHIFAAGDICSPYKFTHMADAMARIVIQNAFFSAFGFLQAKSSALTIPWCTYTDPEIAHVGLYEKEAQALGIPIFTTTIDMEHNDRAILEGDEGFLKIHAHAKKGTILGATLVARHAGEMISEITLAMKTGAGLGDLAKTIHPYPTQAEVFKRAGDAFNKTKLTPTVAKIFDRILRWQR